MNRCLYCYEELKEEESFHEKCSKKFFGLKIPPKIEYSLKDIYKLGKIIVERNITIPGVQTKLSLDLKKGVNNIPKLTVVGLWGNYILKPQSNDYKELPENEDLTMHLAKIFKLNVVEHSLIKLNDNSLAYITKRIDRVNEKKIHMEDMCQLTERLTEDKYKGSLEQIDKIIKKYSANPLLDSLHFFESIIFSFITGNADMHLKNYSLIEEDQIKFAPFYDLLSTRLVISESIDSEEFALSICGKKKKISEKDILKFGNSLNLNEKQIENVFAKFRKNLKKAIDFIDISFLSESKKLEYKKLVKSRSERLNLV
ncbi:MAG: HipA domain-containing protein [Ignavibacteriae bacterium]|nr:HipA domain-containing protein [Ignavibacteriota bacterium]